MSRSWLYTLLVMGALGVLVLGITCLPDLLAMPLAGWFNLGMLIYLGLQVGAPALAFIYLRQRRRQG